MGATVVASTIVVELVVGDALVASGADKTVLVLPVRELGLTAATPHILVQMRIANVAELLLLRGLLGLPLVMEEVVLHVVMGGPAALAHGGDRARRLLDIVLGLHRQHH